MQTPLGNDRGMTMIEVMVALVIVIILAAFAIPNVAKSLPKHQARAEAMAIMTKLQRVRVEALSRGDIIVSFTEVAGGSQFMVYRDLDRDRTFSAGDIALWDTDTAEVEIAKNRNNVTLANTNFNGNLWTGFTALGYPVDGSAGSLDVIGTFSDGTTVTYQLTLSSGGALNVTLL